MRTALITAVLCAIALAAAPDNLSDKLGNGETFEFKFKKAGKFEYGCSYHPRMKGTIVVGE